MASEQGSGPPALPMAQVEPRERGDAAANRARILTAARRVLAEGGPEKWTMDAVACRAGVGKGTLFRRFGDRAGLAKALMDGPLRDFQDRVIRGSPPLGPGAPATERLEAFIVEWLRLQIEHLDAAVLAAAEPGYRDSPAFASLLFVVEIRLGEIDPRLNARVVALMLLEAVSPQIICQARRRGVTADLLAASAVALLRGVTRVASCSSTEDEDTDSNT